MPKLFTNSVNINAPVQEEATLELRQTNLHMRQQFADIAYQQTQKRRSFLDRQTRTRKPPPRLSTAFSDGPSRNKVAPIAEGFATDRASHVSNERKKWQQFRISKIDVGRGSTRTLDSETESATVSRKITMSMLLPKIIVLFLVVFSCFSFIIMISGYNVNYHLGPAWLRFGLSEEALSERVFFDIVRLDMLWNTVLDIGSEQARARVNDITKINCVIFSIVVQVTTILIQVGAREVSSNSIQLFISDKFIVSSVVMYTLTLSYMVVLTNSISDLYIPRGEIVLASVFTLLSVLLLIPYFIYLSRMLNPLRLVRKVAEAGLRACTYVETAESVQRKSDKEIIRDRRMAIWAIENISQVSINAIQNKRLPLAYTCIEVLCNFLISYGNVKDFWDGRWFSVSDSMRETPDFFSLSDRSASALERRRCWLEWKVLRQYHNMFTESIEHMRDVAYVICVNTRRIADAASQRHDYHTLDYCSRFFNTFMRQSIGKREMHTLRNVLHQYTQLCNSVLSNDLELLKLVQQRKRKAILDGLEFHQVDDLIQIKGKDVVEESRDIIIAMEKKIITVAGYFTFYSNLALQAGMLSVPENIAHELASICETAFLRKRECHEELLVILLTLHEVPQEKQMAAVTWGIRTAQIKLATFYAYHGSMEFFRCIQNTFDESDRHDLIRVWRRLERVQDREFWEILDLETNHEYISLERRDFLPEFFEPFGITFDDISTHLSFMMQEKSDFKMPGSSQKGAVVSMDRNFSEFAFIQAQANMGVSQQIPKTLAGLNQKMEVSQQSNQISTDDYISPAATLGVLDPFLVQEQNDEFGAPSVLEKTSKDDFELKPHKSGASSVMKVRRRASDSSMSSKDLTAFIEQSRLASVHSLPIQEEEEEEDRDFQFSDKEDGSLRLPYHTP